MESRFVYPGSAASYLPPGPVFQTQDLNDQSRPYREFRANDPGQYLLRDASDVYSAQPRRRSAVPWWASTDLAPRPFDQRYRQRTEIISEEKLKERLNKYYNSEGLVRNNSFAVTESSSSGKEIKENPQLWRKVCDPKRAVLTEVNQRLVWKNEADYHGKAETPVVVSDNRPLQFRPSMFISQTPYRV